MKDARSKVEKEISALEEEIKASKGRLAKLRRRLAPVKVKDYVLKNTFGQEIALSKLFGNRDTLILIHNMGVGCAFCTMWADGFNGVLKHLEDRASFVVESPDEPAIQKQFAADRGWGFRMVSSKGSPFRKDMGYANDKNSPFPGVSVFTKAKDGTVSRVSDSGFGPGDNFNIVWDFHDLLPKAWTGEEGDYFYSKTR